MEGRCNIRNRISIEQNVIESFILSYASVIVTVTVTMTLRVRNFLLLIEFHVANDFILLGVSTGTLCTHCSLCY